MSSQQYWNNNQSGSYQGQGYDQQYQNQPHGQNRDGYSAQYGQHSSYESYQQVNQSQDNESMNWGYGRGNQQTQPPQQNYDRYQSHDSTYRTTQSQYSSYDQPGSYHTEPYGNQSRLQDPYHSQNATNYDNGGRPSPLPPTAYHSDNKTPSSSSYYDRQPSPHPESTYHQQTQYPTGMTSQYPEYGYGHVEHSQRTQAYPGAPNDVAVEGERGLMGALAGGAAGGFAGHKVNHGFLGTLGGAYAGHKLEDHLKASKKKDKKEKKEKKEKKHGVRRGSHSSSSSSSSSSSDSDSSSERKKKKKKQYNKYGAAAYASSQRQPSRERETLEVMAGNFSASSTQIALDRDYDLIASCAALDGSHRLSSIDLNSCLTNSGGRLEWARGGGFGNSARNVRLCDGGRVLEAELGDGRGGWNWGRVRLDERITNQDGDLRFLD